MADSLNSIGSIATHIIENITGVPTGVSGNMVEIVDMARQHVANWTGNTIGSNSIDDKYQFAITNFAKADVVDLTSAQVGGETLKLADLSIAETGEAMSADQYRKMGDIGMRTLGRKVQIQRSLS